MQSGSDPAVIAIQLKQEYDKQRQPYLKKFPYKISGVLAQADYIHENALYIGNHVDLTKEQIIELCKKLTYF